MGEIIGYNQDYDYLLDPQARDRKVLETCSCCERPIYDGEAFVRFCAGRNIVNICGSCAVIMETVIAGEEESD